MYTFNVYYYCFLHDFKECIKYLMYYYNKSSSVAEMGDIIVKWVPI